MKARNDGRNVECVCTVYTMENYLGLPVDLTSCFPISCLTPAFCKDKIILYLDSQPWIQMPLWTVHWSLVQVIACLCLLGNKHDISNLFAEQWRPNREGALQQNGKWFRHFFDRFTYSKKIQLSLNYMLWWDKLFSWKWAVITCMWIEIKINAKHIYKTILFSWWN